MKGRNGNARKKTDVRRKEDGGIRPFLPFPNEIVKKEGEGRALPFLALAFFPFHLVSFPFFSFPNLFFSFRRELRGGG